MKEPNIDEIKAVMSAVMKNEWEFFEKENLTNLPSPISPETITILKMVFETGFSSGTTFMSMYTANLMLQNKFESILDKTQSNPPVNDLFKNGGTNSRN